VSYLSLVILSVKEKEKFKMCNKPQNIDVNYECVMKQVAKKFVESVKEIKTNVKYYTFCEFLGQKYIASVYNINQEEFSVTIIKPEPENFDDLNKIFKSIDGSLFVRMSNTVANKRCLRIDYEEKTRFGYEVMRKLLTRLKDMNYIDIVDNNKLMQNTILARAIFDDIVDIVNYRRVNHTIPDDECTINTTKSEDSCKARTKQYRDIHYRNEYRSESLEKFRDENINPESINRGIMKYLKKLKDNKMDFKNLNEDLLKSVSNDLMSFIDKEEKYRREKKKNWRLRER
jgi:hypothetical protein